MNEPERPRLVIASHNAGKIREFGKRLVVLLS